MGYIVQAMFYISLQNIDFDLLCQIKDYFAVGSITKQGCTTLLYTVNYLKNLSVIISHFDKY
jgi:LAGLIDADG endonuclease